MTYLRVAHLIRWALELIVIWFFVWPETGSWTAFVLTLMTVGIEFDHLKPNDWKKLP